MYTAIQKGAKFQYLITKSYKRAFPYTAISDDILLLPKSQKYA